VRAPAPWAAPRAFSFDRVFGPDTTQDDIWQEVEPLVAAAVDGYNATVLAYGQTGAGKTYTMMGTAQAPGLVGRALRRLFELIETRPELTFAVHMTFVELHLDQFVDLLDPDMQPVRRKQLLPTARRHARIELHEAPPANGRGVATTFLAGGGATLHCPVTSYAEAWQLVQRGSRARAVAATRLNAASSRAHAVLTLQIESVGPGADQQQQQQQQQRVGKLHLVDLAGSERLARSGAEGEAARETMHINSSLLALGDVLAALSQNSDPQAAGEPPQPVPYRNSKLTRLLQDSLGGTARTAFIVHLHPAPVNYRENFMSLQYAAKARAVRNLVLPQSALAAASVLPSSGAAQGYGMGPLQQRAAAATGAQLAQTLAEVAELRRRLEERERELREARLDGPRMQAAARAAERARRELEQRLARLIHAHQTQAAEQRYLCADLQARVCEAEARLHDYKVRLLLRDDEADELRERVQRTALEMATLAEERDALRAQRARLEAHFQELERQHKRELEQLRRQCRQLTEELERERRTNAYRADGERRRLTEAQEELERLRKHLESRRPPEQPAQDERVRALEEENRRLRTRIARLEEAAAAASSPAPSSCAQPSANGRRASRKRSLAQGEEATQEKENAAPSQEPRRKLPKPGAAAELVSSSPAIEVSRPPAAEAATRRPISTLRDLFKTGALKIPRLAQNVPATS
jgi:hypothetical protein